MRTVTVTVRDGKLVVDGVELPDGAVLNLVVADDADADDELRCIWYEECGDVLVAEETLERFLAMK